MNARATIVYSYTGKRSNTYFYNPGFVSDDSGQLNEVNRALDHLKSGSIGG